MTPQESYQEMFIALMERGENMLELPLAWGTLTGAVKGKYDMEGSLSILEALKKEAISFLQKKNRAF